MLALSLCLSSNDVACVHSLFSAPPAVSAVFASLFCLRRGMHCVSCVFCICSFGKVPVFPFCSVLSPPVHCLLCFFLRFVQRRCCSIRGASCLFCMHSLSAISALASSSALSVLLISLSVCLFVSLSVWLAVCLFVCLFVCLPVCPSVCLLPLQTDPPTSASEREHRKLSRRYLEDEGICSVSIYTDGICRRICLLVSADTRRYQSGI